MKLLVPFALCLLTACGGGGGSSTPAPAPLPHVPGISSLTFTTPMTVVQNSGGGFVTMAGRFDFIDSKGDITTGVLEGMDASGKVVSTNPFPLTGMSGLTIGTAAIAATVPSNTLGTHLFRIHVVDGAGNISNNLSGSFTVVASTSAQAPGEQSAPETVSEPMKLNVIEAGAVR